MWNPSFYPNYENIVLEILGLLHDNFADTTLKKKKWNHNGALSPLVSGESSKKASDDCEQVGGPYTLHKKNRRGGKIKNYKNKNRFL